MRIFQVIQDYYVVIIAGLLALSFGWVTAALYAAAG